MLAEQDKSSVSLDADHSINQRIFETSVDLILVVDRQGRFIRVSPSSQAILGCRPQELIGRNAADFLHPDDLNDTREQMRAAPRTSENQEFESRYIHKHRRSVALAWTNVWSESDGQYFFIGRDMTERNNLEDRCEKRTIPCKPSLMPRRSQSSALPPHAR